MNGADFVEAIKLVVRDSAVSSTLAILSRPPGRSLSLQTTENAAWYASLTEHQKEVLPLIVEAAVDQAIFGMLCVIDGVRAVENGETKGHFELAYMKDKSTLLNSPEGPMLHDLYER